MAQGYKELTNFFLSMSGTSLRSAFSTITCKTKQEQEIIKIYEKKYVNLKILYRNSVGILLPDASSFRLAPL
ncbi:hypothetical protein Hanom_Chr08g00740101 [Helianthus anomalus]